jgi:hypothetical protein
MVRYRHDGRGPTPSPLFACSPLDKNRSGVGSLKVVTVDGARGPEVAHDAGRS